MVVSEKLVVAAGGSHGVVLDGNGRVHPHAPWQDVASRGVLLDMAGERGGAPVPRIAFRSIAAGKVETGFADGAVFRNPADTDGGLAMLLGRVAVPAQFGEAPPAPCLLRIVLAGRGGGGLLGARRDGSTASETLETDVGDHPLFRHDIAPVPVAGLETVGCLSLTRNRKRGTDLGIPRVSSPALRLGIGLGTSLSFFAVAVGIDQLRRLLVGYALRLVRQVKK